MLSTCWDPIMFMWIKYDSIKSEVHSSTWRCLPSGWDEDELRCSGVFLYALLCLVALKEVVDSVLPMTTEII
jgi:hypothetical protein